MKTNKNNRGPFAFVWLIGIPNTAQVKTLPLQCQKQNYGYTLQVGCPIRRFSNQPTPMKKKVFVSLGACI
jgi:hypothetical protein